MKRSLASSKASRPQEDGDCLHFDGKWVEFLFDQEGRLLLLTGEFVLRSVEPTESLDILYTGRLKPADPPGSQYLFHLSRSHLRSTAPALRPGSRADFLMEKPLVASECVKLESCEQPLA